MEVHVVVSAGKGKSKVKRSRQLNVGDKLEYLRSEFDSLTPLRSLEESEKPEESLRAELDSLPSPASLLPHKEPQEPKELEEPEEAEDLVEAEEQEEPKEPEKLKEPGLDGPINDKVSRPKTVQTWHADLLHNLRIVTTPPKVTNSMFCDARELFDVNCDNKVTLRNPGYVGGYEDIVLLQFDPNFMSTEVVCRHRSCNNVNPAAAKSGKRDLYLCPQHQQELRNNISDALKKAEISTSAGKPEPGHFAGYTSLISLLEGAYHDAKKFDTPQGKSLSVEEAILNVRNFLIITSTVLNPDEDNLGIALPPVVEILKLILENPANVERLVDCLIYLLHEVIKMILSAFGVVYTWVSLALGSPGAQIGAGAGGFFGAFAFAVLGLWSGPAGVIAGGIMGGLIGNGIYNLSREQRRQERDRLETNRQPHNQYYFNGDVKGGLYMHFSF